MGIIHSKVVNQLWFGHFMMKPVVGHVHLVVHVHPQREAKTWQQQCQNQRESCSSHLCVSGDTESYIMEQLAIYKNEHVYQTTMM